MEERPVSLLAWAYDQIKDMLLSGELKQGEKVVVGHLAERLSISPTPVKEALNRLTAEGLLITLPHRGFQVKQFTSKEVHDIFDCRLMMETYAASFAIKNWNKHPELKQEMYDALNALSKIPAKDYVAITHMESSFHSCIIRMAENEYLCKLYNMIYSIGFAGFVYAASYNFDKAQTEHHLIYSALEAGDDELLISTLKKHLTQTVDLYEHFASDKNSTEA